MNIHQQVEKLLQFAQSHLMLDDLDVIFARNSILDELKVTDYVQYEIDIEEIESLDKIDSVLDPVVEYAVQKGTCKIKDKQILAANILYILSRRPSELLSTYDEQKTLNPKKALDWLVEYNQKSNFIAYPVLADALEELSKLKLKAPKERQLLTHSIPVIEDLLGYSEAHLHLDGHDIPAARTRLLAELKAEVSEQEHLVDFEVIDELSVPDQVLASAVDYALENKVIKPGQENYLADKIMGLLTKRPSQIYDTFSALHAKNPVKAFEWAYDYAIKSKFVKYSAVTASRHWEAKNTKGRLDITINAARKENSDAEIEKAIAAKSNNQYPKCAICKENEGMSDRKTFRTVPVTLNNSEWFWLFSPFSYFNQHGSLVSSEHTKAKTDKDSFVTALDFCDFLPMQSFVAKNASLPRVGGSILAHDHMQSGKSMLPMFKAPVFKTVKSAEHPYMKIELIDWYLPVIRLSYTNKKILSDYAQIVLDAWSNYNDEDANIIAKTGIDQHNTVAFAARRFTGGFYSLDLILRNNRTDKKHPEGIFAQTGINRAVKSEAVGVIETLGHFILPARLEEQLKKIEKFLTKESRYNIERLSDDLKIFAPTIEKLLKEAGSGRLSQFEAALNIKTEVNKMCEEMMLDCAVFKPTDEGRVDFDKFLATLGIK